ncbi:MAG TPA: hypothetical protein VJQ78_11795 [Sphingobium sp.]|nr:hypothetical protein [Sphingobium sp.]
MGKYILVVPSSALAGREDAYNDWYDNEHLGDLLKIPGIVSGRRYNALPQLPTPAKHLSIFEIEADDPLAVLGELQRRVQAGEMSMTADIDPSTVQMWLYEPR